MSFVKSSKSTPEESATPKARKKEYSREAARTLAFQAHQAELAPDSGRTS